MRVIIAGGGTGGLATALALRKIGVDPLVCEQAPAFAAIGAGLGLQVNAMKAITYLGGDTYWRANSARVDGGAQRILESGELITTSSNALQVEKYGEHYYCGHRADLMKSLLDALPPECVRVASRVVALEETPNDIAVQLDNGEEIRADLLVGADGLRSSVRALLFDEPEARFTGTVVWRGLMQRKKVSEEYDAKILSWLGPRRHVLVYPLRHAEHPESVFSFSGFVPADEVHRESWTASGEIDDLRASLEGACPEIHELLDAMDAALITGIYFRDPLDSWGTERVVLLGDAAHPAPPSAGQGAGMALEDAVMLAACLERQGPGNERAALKEYIYRRRPRTVRMLEASRVNLMNSQQADPVQARARNGYYRGLRRLSPVSPPMAEWLLGHDPVVAAQQSPEDFERSLAVPPNPMRRPEAQRAFDLWRNALTLEHRAGGWLGERRGFEEFLRRECPSRDTLGTREVDADGVPCLSIESNGVSLESGPIVLHIHGGGYVMGSASSSLDLAGRTARVLGGCAIVPDYRLAPEFPFPAALDDVLSVYRWLVAAHPGVAIIVSGEDAGGGLAVALCCALRDAGDPLPQAVFAASPFCDLSVRAEHLGSNVQKDPYLNRIALIQLAASYVQDSEPELALLSPLGADLAGLPPLMVVAASDETLAKSAQDLAAHARRAGVEVELRLVEDSVHSFVLFEFLPEADEVLRAFASFVHTGVAR